MPGLVLPIMKLQLASGVVCLVLAGAAVSGCDVQVGDKGVSFDVTRGRATDEWIRTYPLETGGRLELVSSGGPVYVTPGGADVEVRLLRRAEAASDEAAAEVLKEETVLEEAARDRVRVETKRTVTANGGLGRRRVMTEWHVKIPSGLDVSIKGENADISLTDVAGTFVLENTNGGFRSVGSTGPITATTVNGVIDLDFQQLTGDVKATTVNGMVRIGVPAGANATLEARTVNGGVAVEENLGFTSTERERQRVTGQFGKGGGPSITLNTTNGPVRVRQGGLHMGGRRGGDPATIERRIEGRN